MNAGHVYVLALSNSTVKVGQTQNATQRLGTHKSTARSLGLTVTEEWISPLHAGWLANERALKAIAAEIGGTPMSPEVFSGVSFAAVVEKAQALTFAPPEPSEEPPPQPQPLQPTAKQCTCNCTCQSADDRAIALSAFKEVTLNMVQIVFISRLLLDKGMQPDELEQKGGADAMLAIIMRMLTSQEQEMRQYAARAAN